ncbi:MAG: MaoC/PaaZ C-terminal domain-containing protein [Myxococcota bacterium]
MVVEDVMSLSDWSSLGGGFARAAWTSFRSRRSDPAIREEIRRSVELAVIPERLARYREECGEENDGCLPITYPHALCATAHVALLSDRGFPFPVLGVVHVRNEIEQRRTIEEGATLRAEVSLETHRVVRRGYEYDLETVVWANDEPAWRETTTFLVRASTDVNEGGRPRLEPPSAPERTEPWTVDAHQGRRFAKASWDFNPIHTSRLFARLSGFASPIAHGMWMVARGLGAIGARKEATTVESFFLRPMLLPATPDFVVKSDGDETVFALLRPEDGRPHMVTRVAASTR